MPDPGSRQRAGNVAQPQFSVKQDTTLHTDNTVLTVMQVTLHTRSSKEGPCGPPLHKDCDRLTHHVWIEYVTNMRNPILNSSGRLGTIKLE